MGNIVTRVNTSHGCNVVVDYDDDWFCFRTPEQVARSPLG